MRLEGRRQTDRDTLRSETDRERHRRRQTERDTDGDRQRERPTESDTGAESRRETERERGREKERKAPYLLLRRLDLRIATHARLLRTTALPLKLAFQVQRSQTAEVAIRATGEARAAGSVRLSRRRERTAESARGDVGDR
eukprot:1550330-Rhodomonas_salina.1